MELSWVSQQSPRLHHPGSGGDGARQPDQQQRRLQVSNRRLQDPPVLELQRELRATQQAEHLPLLERPPGGSDQDLHRPAVTKGGPAQRLHSEPASPQTSAVRLLLYFLINYMNSMILDKLQLVTCHIFYCQKETALSHLTRRKSASRGRWSEGLKVLGREPTVHICWAEGRLRRPISLSFPSLRPSELRPPGPAGRVE